ncbi:MAG TPA: sodium/proton-translocating pyrophosphatase, partial [Methanomicrobiales archaeon]|nr:sodium/proton-translocating pyrophosphatase [Methanomicrobiales archaeon]
MDLFILAPVFAVIGLIFAGYSFWSMRREETGTDLMRKIAGAIHLGAMVYLKRQYTAITIFVVAMALILTAIPSIGPLTAIAFVIGAALSATAGFVGMSAATLANVRTTNAARKSMAEAFRVSFSSGMVMGLTVVGLGLLGLSLVFYFMNYFSGLTTLEAVVAAVSGFSFGASSIALFARVGGGIFTKAADVGADLVGKVEAGIPEDDPRNPAVVADNVGDNVGDIAGMGADLYESYVGAMIATMLIGATALAGARFAGVPPMNLILLPLLISAFGIIASII